MDELGWQQSDPAEIWLDFDTKYQLRKQEADTCGMCKRIK